MDPSQLSFLITKVLKEIDLYSLEAVDLLMLTAAQESHCGKYIYQFGKGPALGIFQMEPRTLEDLHQNYLYFRKGTSAKLEQFKTTFHFFDLEGNIPYQIAAARLYYLRFPAIVPHREWFRADDDFLYVSALARYWKKYWNTYAGAGTVKEAINSYNLFVRNA